MSRISAIILNWNNPNITNRCVESLLDIDENVDIIVVDNDSRDGSILNINNFCKNLCRQSEYKFLDPDLFAASGRDGRAICIIGSGRNGGYAFGNNVGIRLALSRKECDYIWILNNDTFIKSRDSLTKLVEKMDKSPDIGLCGSKVIYAEDRRTVQTLGGSSIDQFTMDIQPIGHGTDVDDDFFSESEVEENLSYINGASTFLRRSFIEDVGLMREDYFLYFEEADWAFRANKRWNLGYCSRSIVYHHVGATMGTAVFERQSYLSAYLIAANQLVFCRRFMPHLMPKVIWRLIRRIIYAVRRNNWTVASATLFGMLGVMEPKCVSRQSEPGTQV